MQAPQSQTVVIACPNCGTRYQVSPDTVGEAGRKVSCAECGKAWLAKALPSEPPPAPPAPPPAPPIAPEEEDRLDAAFTEADAEEVKAFSDDAKSENHAVPETAAPPSAISPATRARIKAQGRFRRRQRVVENQLPVAKARRLARIVAAGVLVAILGGLYFFRVEAVRAVPDLASLYAAVGLRVNTVGLEFADVATRITRRDGIDVLAVSGTIYPVTGRSTKVPAVLVDIRGEDGASLYQWSATPKVRTLGPGEVARFSAELASPPAGASDVHLSFSTGEGGAVAKSPETAEPSHSSNHTAGH